VNISATCARNSANASANFAVHYGSGGYYGQSYGYRQPYHSQGYSYGYSQPYHGGGYRDPRLYWDGYQWRYRY
jgi:hypothetical protein